jgi:hypothetical protein
MEYTHGDPDKYLKMYVAKYDDAIPLMEVMGNAILREEFYGCTEAVYAYCLEHNKTWQEVLQHKDNPNVMY